MRAPNAPRIGSGWEPWRSGAFVALDFELTGLDPSHDAIISFGAAPVSGGRVQLADAVYREIRPDVRPSAESVKVHQLRSSDLDAAPPLSVVSNEMSSALAGRFLLTWVAEVEIGFLRGVFGGSWWWWRRRTVDVIDLARVHARAEGTVIPPGEASLSATAKRYGVPVEEAHHALNDALMTAELFLVLATKLSVLGWPRIRDLVRTSQERG
jgi:DNA polymerase-3 subunit epsilon